MRLNTRFLWLYPSRVFALLLLVMCWSQVPAQELTLSEDEQAWAKEHPVIYMCVDPDWLPYEKLDIQGNHIGLVAHYIALIRSRLKLSIEVVKTSSWSESQHLYEQGLCDIVSALNKTQERAKYLEFTAPYIQSPAVLILHETNMADKKLADLVDKSLGMVKGYVYEAKLQEQYPEVSIVYLPNMQTALQKVSTGEVNATLGPLFLTFALIQEQGLDNLKVMGNTEYKDELRIGIRKGDAILATLLQQAVASLTSEDHAAVRRAWAIERKRQ